MVRFCRFKFLGRVCRCVCDSSATRYSVSLSTSAITFPAVWNCPYALSSLLCIAVATLVIILVQGLSIWIQMHCSWSKLVSSCFHDAELVRNTTQKSLGMTEASASLSLEFTLLQVASRSMARLSPILPLAKTSLS